MLERISARFTRQGYITLDMKNLSSGSPVTKPKPVLQPRVCLFCSKEFQPRRRDQKCCHSRCRARLQHNVKLEDSLKILNAVAVGTDERPGTYAFTVRIHGFSVRGFFYDQRTGFIKWPSCFLSYGPFYKQADRGLSIPSKVLQGLIQKWIDEHDSALQGKKVDEEEERKAKREKAKARAESLAARLSNPRNLRQELKWGQEAGRSELEMAERHRIEIENECEMVAWNCSAEGFYIDRETLTAIKQNAMDAWHKFVAEELGKAEPDAVTQETEEVKPR